VTLNNVGEERDIDFLEIRRKNMTSNRIKEEVCVMAIIQEAFDISPDIMTKILTGEYKRIGGVVRFAVGPHKGQIVKHLEPVNLKAAEEAKGIGVKALQFARNNKKALIIAGVGTGLAVAGAGIYHKFKSREPKAVKKFRLALKTYIDAIRIGKLDVKTIDDLMEALETLKKHKNYNNFSIQLSTEEFDVLVKKIYEYTMKLAKDNAVELAVDEQANSEDAIISLQRYLNTQKRIFKMVA